MPNAIVLYVEDEETDALLMQIAFKAEGMLENFRTVSNGRAAIDYLSGNVPHADRGKDPLPQVVLLDLNLPEVHGFEVLRWIRAHKDFKELPVVIFSSSVREEDQLRAREFKANDFVPKPNSPALFRTIVRTLKEKWLQ